jgi:hypothetical protein
VPLEFSAWHQAKNNQDIKTEECSYLRDIQNHIKNQIDLYEDSEFNSVMLGFNCLNHGLRGLRGFIDFLVEKCLS